MTKLSAGLGVINSRGSFLAVFLFWKVQTYKLFLKTKVKLYLL